jgi:hypothetical protein
LLKDEAEALVAVASTRARVERLQGREEDAVAVSGPDLEEPASVLRVGKRRLTSRGSPVLI